MSLRPLLYFPVLLLVACGRAPAERTEMESVMRVKTVPVVVTEDAIPVRVPGIVARRAEAALAFKVGGIVDAVLVRPGDRVEEGQMLARLDPAEIEAQLAQARNVVEKARRDRDRAEELRNREVVSIELAENAATGLAQAEAALRIAEFNRRHAVITAPSGGRILDRLVEPNEAVPANKVAVLFASDDEGWIARAGVPEREVVRIRVGSSATVSSVAHPALAGEVTQISGATDPATGTTAIEVALTTAPQALRSGSVVEVEIYPDAGAARPVVPIEALVEGEGRGAHLFLVAADGRTVRRHRVEVEAIHDGRAFLQGDLSPDSQVVVSGAEFLHEGMAVEVVP